MSTLGDIDLHLFGEGRHEEIYKKLGAHVTKKGVSFAVWAPHARGVSVVGDFNGWNGKDHQMQRVGSSGVWELFIPKLTAGSLYKFEIHPRGGRPILTRNTPKFHPTLHPSSTIRITNFAIRSGSKTVRRVSTTASHSRFTKCT